MMTKIFAAALAFSVVAVPVLSRPAGTDGSVGSAASNARMISASAAGSSAYGAGQGAVIHDGIG